MKFLSLMLISVCLNSYSISRIVYLNCQNPGTHQDVAKTPIITNNTQSNIAASKKIFWNATDGDSGYIMGPLAVGASKQALGNAGNAYQCTAYYIK